MSEKQTYDYGCVMLYFDFPEIKNLHSLIDEEDIYTEDGDRSFGLEDEPHTTLLYGLHDDVTEEDVRDAINGFDYGTCRITNPSLFENENYDVLKFDTSGPNLHETNFELKNYPHTTSFPNYHPHLTIGYLKPGMGKKYVNKLKGLQFKLDPTHVVYSMANGDNKNIEI
jgi:2'-5' RNA ligase